MLFFSGQRQNRRKGFRDMFLNCSNHPSAFWGAAQFEAASAYGDVVDLPFPQVDPLLDSDQLQPLVREYACRIEEMKPDAVMAAGEFTFLFMLVNRLLRDGIKVVCACTKRDTVEKLLPDGSSEKKSIFVFERFRDYQLPD